MDFYFTSRIDETYGYVPPVAHQPDATFPGDDPDAGVNAVVYVNGGWLYPASMPPWTKNLLDDMVAKCEQIAAARPRVVMIDHPQFADRRSRTAMQWMEQAVFRYLRKMLGDDAVIVQYGVGPANVRDAHSIEPSIVLYDIDRIDEFADGSWPEGIVQGETSTASRYDDPAMLDVMQSAIKVRNVWLPAVGQWTPRSPWWTRNDFIRAVAACRARGIDRVFVWFDPRLDDWGRPKFTQQHYEQTVAVVCHHTGWRVLPQPPIPVDDPFGEMLAALAAVPYDHARVLALLAAAKKETDR